jgi:hypothetical protein
MPFRELAVAVKSISILPRQAGQTGPQFDQRRLAASKAADMSSLNFRCITGI